MERNYKVNESIQVMYQAAGAATSLTPLMEIYDETGVKDIVNFPDVNMTEIGSSGRYTGSFTPDQEGEWSVQISDVNGGKVVKQFSVGKDNVSGISSKVSDLVDDVDTVSSDLQVVAGDIGSVSSDLTLVAGDVTSVSSDLQDVAGNIDNVQSDLQIVASDMNSVSSDLQVVAGKVDALESPPMLG